MTTVITKRIPNNYYRIKTDFISFTSLLIHDFIYFGP